jgi:two-component system, NtrC family, response regulator
MPRVNQIPIYNFNRQYDFSRGKMANILIIDDEEKLCKSLKLAMNRMGYNVNFALNMADGFDKVSFDPYDVVFLDVGLPDGNGLEVLEKIKSTHDNPEVIIMTGNGGSAGAETAIKNGAWDYLQKPLSIETMASQLTNALQYREEKKSARTLTVLKREGIIGDSLPIKNCLKQVSQAALSDINVLITGQTGTGKECFATAIHENSSRAEKNFVIVDCAALPETLVESTLFGHVKGSFTGADRDRDGLIKQADGGTLFLDEIGELPMSIQKAFLRVLQEHTFRPVGGKTEQKSNFRLIAATNRDLNQMAAEGLFREDLLFRIKSLIITLPTLKERTQDIQKLAMYYILKICEREKLDTKGFSPEFITKLESYNWPGNVRELFNALEWAISKARYESTLFPKYLPDHIRISIAQSSLVDQPPVSELTDQCDKKIFPRSIPRLKEFREAIILENEKKYLHELLALTNGNINKACNISGLGRSRLYGLMKNYGIAKSY